MSKKEYPYKIALSFATEDLQIAEAISKELSRLKIKHYLFTEEEGVGKDILSETWRVYKEESQFSLMIITKDYIKKKWSGVEREVMQTVNRGKNTPYIIPLRIDDTPVEGLSNNISYWSWEGNASFIAISIYRLIHLKNKKKSKGKKKKYKEQLLNFNPQAVPKNYQVIKEVNGGIVSQHIGTINN